MEEQKLKVLFVVDSLYNAGAEKSLLEITSNFRNILPVFVHIYPEKTLKQAFTEKGIKVYSLDIPGQWNLKLAQKELRFIYEKENPDIVHATLFRSEILTRRLKRAFPHIPLVNSLVNDSYNPLKLENETFVRKLKGKFIHFIDRYTARKVDFFISNSETIKISKSRDLNVPCEKIRVIYRGRDKRKFSDIDEKDVENLRKQLHLQNKQVLLNVGRLIDSKGQSDLIEIMPKILSDHPDIVLIIAGEGGKRTFLENEILRLGLQDEVILLGNRDDIPLLLELSSIFVFPTYMEGLPGALIEAMFSNTLICCSDISVNMECVDENSAVIFKVGDKEDIFSKLNFALSSLPKLDSKSDEALKVAIGKFEIKTVADQYQEFYMSVINKSFLEI